MTFACSSASACALAFASALLLALRMTFAMALALAIAVALARRDWDLPINSGLATLKEEPAVCSGPGRAPA